MPWGSPMPFFNWARWVRSWTRRPQIRTYRRRSAGARKRGLGFVGLGLERLEERVVPAVLAEPAVAGQGTIVPYTADDAAATGGFSPSVAQDPLDANKLIAVYATATSATPNGRL